ncbi:NUDIX hydrolase [Calothrix sp. NIES-3974]|uniref:NUDIX hydrolase n=1 Tax=Calothrix sp. NIES-3974 TaxID=2005462 RepID=UPI000B6105DA|nr:NUDIX domain-containing protein [Calothrix sp. NIES-3974]BAZ07277.1 NUDIX hydrolase [Calothrix sp. NIES-3974]
MTKNILPPTHRVGAFAVIRDTQERVLISHRGDIPFYNLPGGGIEPGESVSDGLLREVREETGLIVKLTKLVGVYSKIEKNEVIITFDAEVIGGELQPTAEAIHHVWVTLGELEKYQILATHLERIYDSFRNQGHAVIKEQ